MHTKVFFGLCFLVLFGCTQGPTSPNEQSNIFFYEAKGYLGIPVVFLDTKMWDFFIPTPINENLIQVWCRTGSEGLWWTPVWYYSDQGRVRILSTLINVAFGATQGYEYKITAVYKKGD
jgi:hypothetical protein